MNSRKKVAINPLPWVMGSDMAPRLDEGVLREAFSELAPLGASAVHADIPAGMDPDAYRTMLAEFELEPAPGFLAVPLEEADEATANLEVAKRHAAAQAALGLNATFLCGGFHPARFAHPARGIDADPARLNEAARQLEEVARAMIAEGVRPALHPHVGFRIEVESEIRSVLDHTDPATLDFGPDLGHLAWAGADVLGLLRDYRKRVGAVHLKDVDANAVAAARAADADYVASTWGHRVWTEPGRGSIDFDAAFNVLGDFDGWFVLEVDVPNLDRDRIASSRFALDWASAHPYLTGGPQ
jgi:inosose dehydratase